VDHFFKNDKLEKILMTVARYAKERVIIKTILSYLTNLSGQACYFNMQLGYNGGSCTIYPSNVISLSNCHNNLKDFLV